MRATLHSRSTLILLALIIAFFNGCSESKRRGELVNMQVQIPRGTQNYLPFDFANYNINPFSTSVTSINDINCIAVLLGYTDGFNDGTCSVNLDADISHNGSASVVAHINDGSGTSYTVVGPIFGFGGLTGDPAVGDFDGDGDLDLIAAQDSGASEQVSVFSAKCD